jgi:hypothetical protein
MVPSVKSPAIPLGIDPETLRLAAQCLNHYATPGPSVLVVNKNFYVAASLLKSRIM